MTDFKTAVMIKHAANSYLAFIPLTTEEHSIIEEDYELYSSGKMEWKAFLDKHGVSPNDIVLLGGTADVTSNFIAPFLDVADVKETANIQFRKSYRCFCGAKHGLDYKNSVLHATASSSWKCLLSFTKMPKYAMVINAKNYEDKFPKD